MTTPNVKTALIPLLNQCLRYSNNADAPQVIWPDYAPTGSEVFMCHASGMFRQPTNATTPWVANTWQQFAQLSASAGQPQPDGGSNTIHPTGDYAMGTATVKLQGDTTLYAGIVQVDPYGGLSLQFNGSGKIQWCTFNVTYAGLLAIV